MEFPEDQLSIKSVVTANYFHFKNYRKATLLVRENESEQAHNRNVECENDAEQ